MLTGLACVRKPGTRRLTSSCGRSFCRRLGSACFAAGPCHRPDFPTRSILQTHGRLEATSAGPGRAQHSAKRGILLYVEPSPELLQTISTSNRSCVARRQAAGSRRRLGPVNFLSRRLGCPSHHSRYFLPHIRWQYWLGRHLGGQRIRIISLIQVVCINDAFQQPTSTGVRCRLYVVASNFG